MNLRKRIRTSVSLFIAILSAVALSTATYSWFVAPTNTIYTDLKGSLVQERFHSGTGTEDDPFVITRPIHYYHMVEFFQRTTKLPIGTIGIVDFGTEYLYFKIGCSEQKLYDPTLIEVTDQSIIDNSEHPEHYVLVDENTQYYVFDYTNYGELKTDNNTKGDKSQTLNMAYYSGTNSLMPVGTSQVPFLGSIDGNFITIDNLNIISKEDVIVTDENENSTQVTRQTNDIGMFGYVSNNSIIQNMYLNNLSITLVDAESNSTIDTSIIETNAHTTSHDSKVHVGYIAGHINLDSTVKDVYVNNCSIKGGNAATSNFGYFGRVDDREGNEVETLGETIASQFSSGTDSGWGGSMDMYSLYNRILTLYNSVYEGTNTVPTAKTITIDEVTNERTETITATTNATYRAGGTNYQNAHYSSEYGGSYFWFEYNNKNYMCMSGVNTNYSMTVTTYTYKDEFYDAIIISKGDVYLGNNDTAISATNSENGTKLSFDDDGYLFTIYDGARYYLTQTNSHNLSLDTSRTTKWTKDGNQLYTTINNQKYYLIYQDKWIISNITEGYLIDDGNGNYLDVNNATSVKNETDEDAASHWYFNGGSGTISTYINGDLYYLYGTNTLSFSPSNATVWTYNNNRLSYSYNGLTYYLTFDNNIWDVYPSDTSKYIHDGNGNYLNASTNAISTGTQQNATKWIFNGTNGTISTVINHQIYYLNGTNQLSIGQNNPTTWTYNNGNYTYAYNNQNYYLVLDNNTWDVYPSATYRLIHDGNGNYLNASTNAISTGTQQNATKWIFNGTNGTISTIINHQTYYLNGSNQLSVGQNNPTTWTFDNNQFTYTYNTQTYYLEFENNVWGVYPTTQSKLIHDGNGHYLNGSNNAISTGTQQNATKWIFNGTNGTISTIINGQTYYLIGTNQLSIGQNNPTSWTYDNGVYTYTYQTITYYLEYENNTWNVYPSTTSKYIHDGNGNYLNGSNNAISTGTVQNATKWIFNGTSGTISTIINGQTYYLIGTNQLSMGQNNPTTWTYNNGIYTYTYNTQTYYLEFENNVWGVYPTSQSKIIHDGNGHYLNASTDAISVGTEQNSTKWIYNGTNGTISTIIDGQTYYLIGTNQLSIGQNNPTIWTYNNGIYTYTYQTITYYLEFENNAWNVYPSTTSKYIHDGNGNYLNGSNNAISTGTVQNATKWIYNGTSGTISTIINGQTYYLIGTNQLSMGQNNPTSWTYSNNEYSYTYDGLTYYLVYNNGYDVYPSTSSSYIHDGNGNYLNGSASVVSTGTQQNATKWIFNGTSGTISTIINHQIYYLNGTNQLSIGQDNPTTWSFADGEYSYTYDGLTYYLVYEDGYKVYPSKNYYTFSSGSNYLVINNGQIDNTTNASNATRFIYNGTNGTLMFISDNAKYYLNRDGNISNSSNTNWQFSNNRLYYNYNSTNYYLIYANESWIITTSNSYYTINDGSTHYLNATSSFFETGTQQTATKWFYNGTSGTLSTEIDGQIYYINKNGAISTNSDSTSWIFAANTLYYTDQGENYYLNYSNNSWNIICGTETVKISDGLTYLNISANGISSTENSDAATEWVYAGSGNTISTLFNGAKYYLYNNNGNLEVSTTNQTNWNLQDNHLYSTINTTNYYICFSDDMWVLQNSLERKLFYIEDFRGHYLSVDGTNLVSASSTNDATLWDYNGTNGTISTKINDTTYYLRAQNVSNNQKVTLSNTNSSTWTYDANGRLSTGSTYYLLYNNGYWIINNSTTYYTIKSGNNYLCSSTTNTNTAPVNGTNANEATLWVFSNVSNATYPQGTITTGINGTTCYLARSSNSAMSVNASTQTSWTSDTSSRGKIYCRANGNSGRYCYIRIQTTTWNLANSNNQTTARKNGTTLTFTSNDPTFTAYDHSIYSSLFEFDEISHTLTINISSSSFVVNGNLNNLDVSLALTNNNENVILNLTNYNENINLAIANYDRNINLAITNYDENINLAIANYDRNINLVMTSNDANINLAITNNNENVEFVLTHVYEDLDDSFADTLLQNCIKTVQTNQRSGHNTYIPLKLELQDEEDLTSYYSDYRASNKNTGYIVGSGYFMADSSTPNSADDIRISKYAMSSISGAMNGNTTYSDARIHIITRTAKSNGYAVISDSHNASTINTNYTNHPTNIGSASTLGLVKYESDKEDVKLSRDNLKTMLEKDTRYVYGLHFMDSLISKDRTIFAKNARIMGKTYPYLEMPESCIDFSVDGKGIVNFFAGTYFTGNDSFFSLHQIYRHPNTNIKDIKEIRYIYESKDKGVLKPYIYEYTDGTFTKADGTYNFDNPDTTLDSNYTETPIFDTNWITHPDSLVEKAIYYFEVPCNKGEYALGSVSGGTGAYLFYLDIGSDGGSVIDTTVSATGNEVSNSLFVDYRSANDKTNWSILQLSINCPEVLNPDDFEIRVEFDKNASNVNNDPDGQFVNGLYTIYVTNKSNSNLILTVFLTDDDNNNGNNFLYAYRVIYTNATQTNEIITNNGYEFFKSVKEFTITYTDPAQ